MGEGLFRGCCAPEGVGMVAAWRSRHMVDVWFAGTLDAQTCQQIHKRTPWYPVRVWLQSRKRCNLKPGYTR
jgi:hypothetical protein